MGKNCLTLPGPGDTITKNYRKVETYLVLCKGLVCIVLERSMESKR
jgi:hypothetical protein